MYQTREIGIINLGVVGIGGGVKEGKTTGSNEETDGLRSAEGLGGRLCTDWRMAPVKHRCWDNFRHWLNFRWHEWICAGKP